MYFRQIVDKQHNLLNFTSGDITNNSTVRRRLKRIISSLNPDYIGSYVNSTRENLTKTIVKYLGFKDEFNTSCLVSHSSFLIIERLITQYFDAEQLIELSPQFPDVPAKFGKFNGDYKFFINVDRMIKFLKKQSKGLSSLLVYIDNPNNPTRTSNEVSGGCFRINIPSSKMAIERLIKLLNKFYEKKDRDF